MKIRLRTSLLATIAGMTFPILAPAATGSPPNIVVILADDPAETRNVAVEHPEVVERLSARLREQRERGQSRP